MDLPAPLSSYLFLHGLNHINAVGHSPKLGAQIQFSTQTHEVFFRAPAFHFVTL